MPKITIQINSLPNLFILIILTGNTENGGEATGGAVQHDDGHYQAEQGNNFNSLWSELYPNMNRVNGVTQSYFSGNNIQSKKKKLART